MKKVSRRALFALALAAVLAVGTLDRKSVV